MVIDTSAIVAIALDESEAETFEQRIADSPVRLISAATVLEAAMVIETRLGEPGGVELDLWLLKAGVEIVAVDAEQADQARRAWRRFGKGRHPAGLNCRRLLLLCPVGPDAGAPALQGRRFLQDRHRSGLNIAASVSPPRPRRSAKPSRGREGGFRPPANCLRPQAGVKPEGERSERMGPG